MLCSENCLNGSGGRAIASKRTYPELLKNKDFRLLMASQGISNMGDWLIIGILMVIVGSMAGKESTLAISGLWIAKMLPIILSPVIGTLVDTVDRKKGMIFSDLVRGALIALVPLAVAYNSLLFIYAIIFFSEVFTLFFVPSKDASIPNIVKREQLLDANSLSFSINQITMFVGLALGTTIIFTVNKIFGRLPIIRDFTGTYTAVYVDALTFFISAVILAFIAFPKKEKKVSQSYRQFFENIIESFGYLLANKKIRWLIVSVSVSLLGLGTILVIGPEYAQRVLRMGKEGFLPLLTILSLGLLTGAFTVKYISWYMQKETIFSLSLGVLGAGFLALSFISYFEIAAWVTFISGFSLGTLYVSAYTIMHESISDRIRGRLFTALESDVRLAIIVSALVTGIAASLIGTVKIGQFAFSSPKVILFLGGLIIIGATTISIKYVARRVLADEHA